MIKNYVEFEEFLDKAIVYRSKNYVNTDCSISTLIELVYQSITNEVIFFYTLQEIDYNTPADLILPNDNGVDELYGPVLDASDEQLNDISDLLIFSTEPNLVFKDEYTADYFKGKKVIVLRPVTKDVKNLDMTTYNMLVPCMIEGLMYHIEESVPSPVDNQIARNAYAKFMAEIEKLRNKLPQIQKIGELDAIKY